MVASYGVFYTLYDALAGLSWTICLGLPLWKMAHVFASQVWSSVLSRTTHYCFVRLYLLRATEHDRSVTIVLNWSFILSSTRSMQADILLHTKHHSEVDDKVLSISLEVSFLQVTIMLCSCFQSTQCFEKFSQAHETNHWLAYSLRRIHEQRPYRR
jgi:hypothetical protein